MTEGGEVRAASRDHEGATHPLGLFLSLEIKVLTEQTPQKVPFYGVLAPSTSDSGKGGVSTTVVCLYHLQAVCKCLKK